MYMRGDASASARIVWGKHQVGPGGLVVVVCGGAPWEEVRVVHKFQHVWYGKEASSIIAESESAKHTVRCISSLFLVLGGGGLEESLQRGAKLAKP
jgi:hypothetical protein